MNRRLSRQVRIGNVAVGADAPISIQSMASVPTSSLDEAVRQIRDLEEAGCEIIRVGVPDAESAKAIRNIRSQIGIPLVADIHFDYRLALIALESGADALRINPGNLKNRDEVEAVVKACRDRNVPIRIGVNSGSIDRKRFAHPTPEALVDSALGHIGILESLGFQDIKVSLKASDVTTTIEAYRLFASQRDYPLHLGVTEAGDYEQALVKSSIGIGTLLYEGIGDTIRVSITGDPVKEVEAAKTILRSLGIRLEGIEIVSCPMCARKEFDVEAVVNEFRALTKGVKKYMRVAIMGCSVNGPGESQDADAGVAVGKTEAVLFRKGKVIRKIAKDSIVSALLEEVENYGG